MAVSTVVLPRSRWLPNPEEYHAHQGGRFGASHPQHCISRHRARLLLYQAHLDGFRELGVEETEAVAAMKRSIEIARRGMAGHGGAWRSNVGALVIPWQETSYILTQ